MNRMKSNSASGVPLLTGSLTMRPTPLIVRPVVDPLTPVGTHRRPFGDQNAATLLLDVTTTLRYIWGQKPITPLSIDDEKLVRVLR